RSRFAMEVIYPEIRELLDKFGIRIGEMPVAQAVARIQSRSLLVRQQLVIAILDYANYAPNDDPQLSKWLRAVFEATVSEPWRDEVQKAILAKNWKDVERLVREADLGKQLPSHVLRLAAALPEELKSLRLEVYRKIHRAHPGDVWVNISLAWELIENGRHEEAIRYLTAALALRPNNPGILLNRGNCFHQAGEIDAAIVDYQQCLAVAPRY